MTGYELLARLLNLPPESMARDVVIETGVRTPDVPLVEVAMTGPGPGILLLTTEVEARPQ